MNGTVEMLRGADSPLVARLMPSPNFGVRRGAGFARHGIDMVVLHYTGCPSAEAAALWMCSPEAQVSAHYLVDEDGEIIQLVAEEMRAWHAGAAFWAGEEDVNSRSIGIEIQNAGHVMPDGGCGGAGGEGEGDLPPYPAVQVAAVKALLADIMVRHGIAPVRVVGHSDVAPERKADPGEHFPWDELARDGLALPVPEEALPQPVAPPQPVALDAAGVEQLQRLLVEIGYGVPVSGKACGRTQAVVRAFQRRFMPRRVNGVIDTQVLAVARVVAEMVAERGASAYI